MIQECLVSVLTKKKRQTTNKRFEIFGIENAIGNYLFFLDADDFLEKHCLKKLLDKLSSDAEKTQSVNTDVGYKQQTFSIFFPFLI